MCIRDRSAPNLVADVLPVAEDPSAWSLVPPVRRVLNPTVPTTGSRPSVPQYVPANPHLGLSGTLFTTIFMEWLAIGGDTLGVYIYDHLGDGALLRNAPGWQPSYSTLHAGGQPPQLSSTFS